MTVKYVRTRNGKAWVQIGERNEDEWMEWLEESNANGVAKITSINHRAALHQSRQQAQDGEDPEPQG
jgi:peptidyl-tRNA hydrolase